MKQVKAGIIGGAGYTGGELIRILINHPNVEIVFIHSKSNAGNYVYEAHADLLGDTQLKFTSEIKQDIDVLFLCVGHGDAKKFLEANKIPEHIKIIDLSQDYRINATNTQEERSFIYGLPELQKEKIKSAHNIANPGCFSTCIQLGLLPLAAGGFLQDDVHISAITGSTGAGQSLSSTSHFSWRNNNISVYKAFQHQHLREIKQSVTGLQQNYNNNINFIPYRGDFTRGIIATMYTTYKQSLDMAKQLYNDYYKQQPFVCISEKNIDLKLVVNTNNCFLYLEKHEDKLMVVTIIDNLLKGASGQAVQNMNLMFGLDEVVGLRLKPSAF